MPGPRKNLTPLDMKMMGLAFNQGGVINFLGKQPEVTAPVRAQSHADSPPVQLAYITDAEKDLLVKSNIHGSMDGKPNPGPAGLESLDDFFTTPGGGISGGSTSNTGGSVGGGGSSGGGTSAEDYGIFGGGQSGQQFGGAGGAGMAVGSDGTVYDQTQYSGPGVNFNQSQIAVLEEEQKKLEELKAKKQAETLAKLGIEQSKTLTDTLLGKAGDIKTKIMGGGEGGNLDLTKEEAYANLPAGMHPLRKQYEYLKEKYGPNWANTTQAKVLESYLSGVPVERGGGLGAKDDTYGGGKFAEVDQFGNAIDPEQFEVAEKFRQQLLNSMGLAGSDIGGMNTMGTVAEQLGALSDTDYNKLRYGLSPEQFFNFNQQLMAADPSAGNEAYKAARPFSSGAGLGALASKFLPGANMISAMAGGIFPERDLSGFENYADYEKAGAAFRPLPVPEQSNMQDMSRPIRPGYKFPDAEAGLPTPVYPRYPLPGDPKRPPFGPPFMPDGGNFPLPVGINAFNPMFLGPSFRGSPYTNRGVSPAFYDALRRFA
jgi:hypothetical protein